jgi:hypothetical protein
MSRDAPGTIAQAYGRLAMQAAANGQLKSAVELINRGSAAAPRMEAMVAAQTRYRRYQALDDYLTGGAAPDVRKVRREISDLYAQDPTTARVVVALLAQHLASRAHSGHDPQLAVSLSRAGSVIFGEGPPFRHN